ncbi:MAG: S8 family serine peptidase [Candidatus Eisenbacteria bacterium]
MRIVTILTAALVALTAIPAFAGTIHPGLEARMEVLREGEPISAIVHMTEQAPIEQLNMQLKAERSSLRDRHQIVIEALHAASRSQDLLREYLDQARTDGRVLGYTSYWISNMLVVYAPKEEIFEIAARADVDYVEPNFTVSLIEPVRRPLGNADMGEEAPLIRGIGITPGLTAIRAPEVWNTLGYDGAGTLIGSFDTGVDGSHPALASRWRGLHAPWQECWLDVLGNGTTFPTDNYGHGTHTTGTMTGLAPDDTIGVAPGAEWIACNPIDQGVGAEFDNDVINCFQWFADPDGDPFTNDDVPDVVQNSWRINEGFGGGYTDCDSRWWAAMDNCEASGVVLCFSAGNEGGSGAQTIGSPADRATTLTNAFSIGAVDATNYGWPYPIAYFSSRGPSGCVAPAENKIKPEVCAPGVDVYSSVPGGGYQGGWDGTSMSGPHVAGTVALMRQANPDLDVDTIKEILMDTARDEGSAGEDNTYGHGFIDAYEAVLSAVQGFGFVEGTVTNGDWGDAPLPGATVELVGTQWGWTTDGAGNYSGAARESTYTIRASLAGFTTINRSVDVISGETVIENFSLRDIAGPAITNVSEPLTATDPAGPYPIDATIQDYSTVVSATLYYRINDGPWMNTAMASGGGDVYSGDLPGAPSNSRIDYYVRAVDGVGIASTNPANAPASFYSLYITQLLYAYAAEDPNDPDWQLGVAGDDATTGVWERLDPNGTYYGTINVQPEDDHTADPGVKCFVTGNGPVGGGAGDNDVDNGCTTLMSPVFDLTGVGFASARYWRWYGEAGSSIDDEFVVEISDDGGSSWSTVEIVPDAANVWTEVVVNIDAIVDLTDQVVFRFVACDLNTQGLVEGAIDDFAIESYGGIDTDVAAAENMIPALRLMRSRPNPYRPNGGEIAIRFALPEASQAEVRIFDVAGRVVRTVAEGRFPAGEHHLAWDGRDDSGREVTSGVYFYRLKMGDKVESRRLTLLR